MSRLSSFLSRFIRIRGRNDNDHHRLEEDEEAAAAAAAAESTALNLESGIETTTTKKSRISKLKNAIKGQFELVTSLLPYLWPRNNWALRFRVILSLLCLVIAKVVNVSTPLAYKKVIDILSLSADDQRAYPALYISLYGLGLIGNQLFSNLRDSLFVKVSQHAMSQSAVQTFAHLHSLSISFHVNRKTGGVLRGIDRGTRGISFLTSFLLFNTAPLVIELTLISILLIFQMPFLTAIVVLCVLFYVVFTLAVTEWRTKLRKEMNESENRANDVAVDSLLNYETVKVFGNEQHEQDRYEKLLLEYNAVAEKSQLSLAFLNIGQSVIISTGQLVLMFLTAFYVYRGEMSVGTLVAVNSWLIQVYAPLSFLGSSYRVIKQSLIDIESMFDILRETPDVKDPVISVEPEGRGMVELDNVKFKYPSHDRPVLRSISFSVQLGHQLAIVGGSGAGKSTIVKLLYRFYDVEAGAVRIDGIDIREMSQESLRKQIAIVPQDTVLFNDTIKYNIQYGNLQASDAEVEEAARMANLLQFIESLPDGWNTKVGERGLRLSGGEKQRVSIARAILKKAPITVFDEATSSLDTVTEKQIQDNLRHNFKGRKTIIILAHRLSTIVDSDEILVVKNGKVHERGTFDQLLAMEEGEFRKLWLKQSEKEQNPDKKEENGDPDGPPGASAALSPQKHHHHHHHHG